MSRGVMSCVFFVPDHLWQAGDDPHASLAALARAARESRVRVEKRADETEPARYARICGAIESLTVSLPDQEQISFESRDEDFIATVRAGGPLRTTVPFDAEVTEKLADSAPMLGSTTFAPEDAEAALAALNETARMLGIGNHPAVAARLRTLELAARSGCGLVEFVDWHATSNGDTEESGGTEPRIARIKDEPAQGTVHDDDEPVPTGNRRERLIALLSRRLDTALAAGGSINVGSQPHEVITEVLRSRVERAARPREATVGVVYGDGSEAEPFPLRCIPSLGGPFPEEALRVRAVLVSMRHPELDAHVDLAWFRNRDVSRWLPHAEVDRFCTSRSVLRLRELIDAAGEQPVRLDLYQTGLQPAVVGFYRALTTLLADDGNLAGRLSVVPRYFRGAESGPDYAEGTAWMAVPSGSRRHG